MGHRDNKEFKKIVAPATSSASLHHRELLVPHGNIDRNQNLYVCVIDQAPG